MDEAKDEERLPRAVDYQDLDTELEDWSRFERFADDQHVVELRARAKKQYLDKVYLVHSKQGTLRAGQALARTLASNSTLTSLALSLGLEGSRIGEALSKNSTLTRLDLTQNSIGKPGLQALARGIVKQHVLTDLCLRRNLIYTPCVSVLSRLIRSSALTSLDLGVNKIGSAGVPMLSSALAASATLQKLNLDNNQLGSGIELLCAALRDHPSLTDLSLSMNDIKDRGATLVGAMLEGATRLRSLVLDDNIIEPNGLVGLMAALSGPCSLEKLSLAWNPIGAVTRAGAALGTMLAKNTTLTWLNACDIELPSAEGIFRELMSNQASSLTHLDLSVNAIGTEGARALAALLATQHTSLRIIRLGRSGMTTEEARVVAAGLRENKTLLRLDLTGNALDTETLNELIEVWEAHDALLSLELPSRTLSNEKDENFKRNYDTAKFNCMRQCISTATSSYLPIDLCRIVVEYASVPAPVHVPSRIIRETIASDDDQ